MKKTMLLAVMLLFLMAGGLFAQKVGANYGRPIPNFQFLRDVYLYNLSYTAPRMVYVWANDADSLRTYEVVIWDSTAVKACSVVCDGTGADTFTIVDSLAQNRWFTLFGITVNNVTADSIFIEGKDSLGTAATATIVLNGNNDRTDESSFWTEIDNVYATNHAANETLYVYAVPFNTVATTTTAGHSGVAGVVYSTILDDSLGLIVIQGLYKAKMLGTTEIFPGSFIQTSTTAGSGLANATEAAGAGVGTALQNAAESGTYWLYVSPAY